MGAIGNAIYGAGDDGGVLFGLIMAGASLAVICIGALVGKIFYPTPK